MNKKNGKEVFNHWGWSEAGEFTDGRFAMH